VLLVIVVGVVILFGVLVGVGVELLSLGAVRDEVSGVAALEASPKRSPPLLAELV
jgi:hypothetical protein